MPGLKYIQLYHSYLDAIELLGDAERGRLFTAMLEYGALKQYGRGASGDTDVSTKRYENTEKSITEKLTGNERILFPMMKAQIDRDNEAYEEKCQRNSANVNKRWNTNDTNEYDRIPPNTNDTKEKEKEKKKEKKKDNIPPTPLLGTKEADTIVAERGFPQPVEAKVREWLQYKIERKEDYKPTGLSSLLTEIVNCITKYGESAVIEDINTSMARGWRGIFWSKTSTKGDAQHDNSNGGRDGQGSKYDMSRFHNAFDDYDDDGNYIAANVGG